MTKFIIYPHPHYDAGNGPGSSSFPSPVLTPSERLAKAKELIVALEDLGIGELGYIVAEGKAEVLNIEDRMKAEATVLSADAAAVVAKIPSLTDIEALLKTELSRFSFFEKSFCDQHALSIQALNTWIAVIGGIVLLKLLKVI